MKQIFTLVLATALSVPSAFSQTVQTFESLSNLESLTDNCWQFTNLGLSSSSVVNETKSVYTNTTNKLTAYVVTPYINLTTSTTLSFNYRLVGSMTGKRYIRISLIDINNVSTSLGIVTFDRHSTNNVTAFSVTSPLAGVQKLQLEITSGSEGASDVYVDNISVGGTFNNTSPYSCNAPSNSALPIHLMGFTAIATGDKASLQWTVADNEDGARFEVLRSNDGKAFTSIATLPTTGKVGEATYSYADDLAMSAFYRLKLVNKNGGVILSEILLVKKGAATITGLSLLQNPVKETLKISFSSPANAPAQVAVYNTSGAKVYQATVSTQKGSNTISMTLDGQIKRGTYVLELTTQANRGVVKFLKD